MKDQAGVTAQSRANGADADPSLALRSQLGLRLLIVAVMTIGCTSLWLLGCGSGSAQGESAAIAINETSAGGDHRPEETMEPTTEPGNGTSGDRDTSEPTSTVDPPTPEPTPTVDLPTPEPTSTATPDPTLAPLLAATPPEKTGVPSRTASDTVAVPAGVPVADALSIEAAVAVWADMRWTGEAYNVPMAKAFWPGDNNSPLFPAVGGQIISWEQTERYGPGGAYINVEIESAPLEDPTETFFDVVTLVEVEPGYWAFQQFFGD